ncbi:MAG: dTDP-glucose 4,6-dehydratase [Candidatus Nitrosotenuis sp.]
MRVVVTGGLGFIGSNFILQFLKRFPKSHITNIDAKLKASNPHNLDEIKKSPHYRFIYGNIANKKLVDSLISKSDVVFNFAAESHVDRSILSPEPFIRSNIVGVFNILESVRKYKKKLIQISTDEVFGDIKKGSADENYPLNPSSPYSSSKASAELLVKSYIRTYGIDAIITRCTNNFGPRQDFEKLIPKTILFAQKNKKIPIYGTGKAVRDWIFVNDHCNAIMKIFHDGKWGESYNISTYNELDNLSVVKKILKILGKPRDLFSFVKDRPGHDLRYSLDSTKIRRQLKWKPQYKFDDALEHTVKWYLQNNSFWRSLR